MNTLVYKYKVYSQNRSHEKKLRRLFRTCTDIYNHCIALHKRHYAVFGICEGYKPLSRFRLQKHIAKMKKRCHPEWSVVNSQAVQEIAERIDNGYRRFFDHTAKHPPTFRSCRKYRSLTFKDTGWKLYGNDFIINSLSLRLRFHQSRPIPADAKIQRVTLKRDAVGDYWLSFILRTEETSPAQAMPMMGKTTGLDFGLKHFLTTAEGERIESPQVPFSNLSRLRRVSRNLSKKRKGSNNRKRAREELARLNRRISYLRSEHHWKTAIELVRSYDVVCIESLDLKSMKREYGRKVSDLGFGSFVNILASQCTKYGRKLIQIDKWEPTSKTCSHCGHKLDELPLKVRRWNCPECGASHDRDINAARNILRVGTSTLGRGNVSPVFAGCSR